MMKAFYFVLTALSLVACQRKSVPPASTAGQPVRSSTAGSASSGTVATAPAEKPVATAPKKTLGYTPKPIIVVDGNGNFIPSRETLTANGATQLFEATQARAFTPQQRANLLARFKTVPPRVMHVPEGFAKTSSRGTYWVMRNKFWYWKKADGYFYLDENYYQ